MSAKLKIATIEAGNGHIGLSMCPGRRDRTRRSLKADVKAVADWGADVFITLIEMWEFQALDVRDLPYAVGQHGMMWLWLPIQDGFPPSLVTLRMYDRHALVIRDIIDNQGRVFVHCKGGLGRAGTIAAMLLTEQNFKPQIRQHIATVRAARGPLAIEPRQENWLIRKFAC